MEKLIEKKKLYIYVYLFFFGGGVDFTGHSYMLFTLKKIQNSFFWKDDAPWQLLYFFLRV